MKILKLILCSLALLSAVNAHAYVVCTTNSSGLTFQDADQDPYSAMNRTENDCTANASTNNGQCRANISCLNNGYPVRGLVVACYTQSNGLNFADGASDQQTAMNAVINDCTANASTNNGQCRAEVNCREDGVPLRVSMYSCTTSSNGLNFTDAAQDLDSALNAVVNACTANASTNNGQCRADVACSNGGYSVPTMMVTCTTSSNGLNFLDAYRDQQTALNAVINDCTANASTNNAQCRVNASCSGGGAYPNPPPYTPPPYNPYPGGSPNNPIPGGPGYPPPYTPPPYNPYPGGSPNNPIPGGPGGYPGHGDDHGNGHGPH